MPRSDDDYDRASRLKRSQDEYAQHLQQMERLRQTNDEQRHQPPQSGSMSTPFAAFKRFIDDNFTTFTDNFKNLPSNIAELRANMHTEQRRLEEEEREISSRWTGSADSPDRIQTEVDRIPRSIKEELTIATRWMIEHAARENAHVPLSKIAALYEDRESGSGLLDQLASPLLALGGTWYYMPETGDTLPTASNWSMFGRPTPRWLSVDWFKRSPYSPIQLEAHPDAHLEGLKWRAAFEDLMCAALDKPMTAQQHRDVDLLPGLHWMISLQDRSVLPPLLPRFYSDVLARREFQGQTMQDIVARCNTPWGVERGLPWLDSLNQDFAELRSAFATRESVDESLEYPDTELTMYEQYQQRERLEDYQRQLAMLEKQNAERLVVARAAQSGCPAYSRALDEDCEDDEEEEDDDGSAFTRAFYGDDDDDEDDQDDEDDDACPFANELRRRAMQAHEWNLLREAAGFILTGNRESDFEDAVSAFGDALTRKDAQTAANVLNTWYEHYQDLKIVAPGIVDSSPKDCWATALRAVDHSRVPALDGTGSIEELMRTLGCFEGEGLGKDEGLRGELYRRLVKVLPEETGERRGVGWLRYAFMDLAELEENIEALEEQRENIERMVGGKGVLDSLVEAEKKKQADSHGFEVQRRPDVLSALTTTQTTRLPDGTVTTKVVLKKRFADGREESSESVHTHHEASENSVQKAEAEKKDSGKGKGWFWT